MAAPPDQPVWKLFKWVLMPIFALVLVVALMMPGAGTRPGGHRMQCVNNIRNISLALHNYHSRFGSFPPAYIADANGRPMHSWRVRIVLLMDSAPLDPQWYHYDEPWDGLRLDG